MSDKGVGLPEVLRALAEIIGTKAPAKELTDAADALTPFGHYKMEVFALFLKLAQEKYGATGELPDGKPPKPAPKPKKEPTPKTPTPTVEDLLTYVESLKVRLRTDRLMSNDGVAAELKRFEMLSKDDLCRAVLRLGMQTTPKNKGHAMTKIVYHTISVQGGIERSDA